MVVKNGKRVCGTGAVLANAPIVQNKAYFEMKVQCGGETSTCTDTCQQSRKSCEVFVTLVLAMRYRLSTFAITKTLPEEAWVHN